MTGVRGLLRMGCKCMEHCSVLGRWLLGRCVCVPKIEYVAAILAVERAFASNFLKLREVEKKHAQFFRIKSKSSIF